MLEFNVPPGLGDISWIYSKLVNLGRPFKLNICENYTLNRASGFVDLLPGVVNGGYKNFSYQENFISKKLGLPVDTDMKALPDGEYFLSANLWLDAGNRLETFLPGLETSFHYEMNIPQVAKDQVAGLMKGLSGPIIAIYTSKYNAPETGWFLWSPEQWEGFCRAIYNELGGCSFVFLGAKFDLTVGIETAERVKAFAPVADMIGKTEVSHAVEILKQSDYLFAFPSGIGILGDVVNTPTLMFLPSPRHDKLKDTYADPENVRSGKHLNVMYCAPWEAFEIWKERGKQHMRKAQ